MEIGQRISESHGSIRGIRDGCRQSLAQRLWKLCGHRIALLCEYSRTTSSPYLHLITKLLGPAGKNGNIRGTQIHSRSGEQAHDGTIIFRIHQHPEGGINIRYFRQIQQPWTGSHFRGHSAFPQRVVNGQSHLVARDQHSCRERSFLITGLECLPAFLQLIGKPGDLFVFSLVEGQRDLPTRGVWPGL